MKIMPDGSRVERPYETTKSFLWNVISNLRPEFAVRIVEEADIARQRLIPADMQRENLLEIKPEFIEALMSCPIICKYSFL